MYPPLSKDSRENGTEIHNSANILPNPYMIDLKWLFSKKKDNWESRGKKGELCKRIWHSSENIKVPTGWWSLIFSQCWIQATSFRNTNRYCRSPFLEIISLSHFKSFNTLGLRGVSQEKVITGNSNHQILSPVSIFFSLRLKYIKRNVPDLTKDNG